MVSYKALNTIAKSLEVVGNSKVTDYLKLLNYMCFITKKKTSAF